MAEVPVPVQRVDPPGPSIWDALDGDPTHLLDRRALRLLERDTDRWSARWMRVPARLVSRLVVAVVTVIKRLLPFEFSSHDLLDRLGIWFLSRCVSEEGGELLLRHFAIETNLLACIAANSGLEAPTLRPRALAELDDNAVIVHDLNVYEVLAALGNRPLPPPDGRDLDLSMLDLPEFETATRRRLLRLDLETGLAAMNIAFALLTTTGEYRRAVHSLQLDESILSCLSELTGDDLFRTWNPAGLLPIVRTGRDVPRDLFVHAIVNEYAHARLRWHATRRRRTSLPERVAAPGSRAREASGWRPEQDGAASPTPLG
jgi:hypothetical protein